MKINKTKLVVGVLAVAGVASLVGSISGTVAWFQYNTRTSLEFTGTSAKCTEFLEMRTVKDAVANKEAKGTGATNPTDATGLAVNDLFLNNDGKVYKITAIENATITWDEGTAANTADRYKVGEDIYKWNGTAWVVVEKEYGEWLTYLDKTAFEALGNDSEFSPVTNPGVQSADDDTNALGDFYGHPVAGYEKYAEGTYHWKKADRSDYAKFSLQFRVLDLNGEEITDDNDRAMLEKDLWITDLTMQNVTSSGKEDITSALRFYVSDGTGHKLFAKGLEDGDDEITTVTHGNLNLGGIDKNAPDVYQDVPNHYSFTDGSGRAMDDLLDYGGDIADDQVAINFKKADALFPTNDGTGHLTGGNAIAETEANDPTEVSHTAFTDDDYLTLDFAIWLEGWAELGDPLDLTDVKEAKKVVKTAPVEADLVNYEADDVVLYGNTLYKAGTTAWTTEALDDNALVKLPGGAIYKIVSSKPVYQAPLSIWDEADYVGSQFNIGISFGVDTLR